MTGRNVEKNLGAKILRHASFKYIYCYLFLTVLYCETCARQRQRETAMIESPPHTFHAIRTSSQPCMHSAMSPPINTVQSLTSGSPLTGYLLSLLHAHLETAQRLGGGGGYLPTQTRRRAKNVQRTLPPDTDLKERFRYTTPSPHHTPPRPERSCSSRTYCSAGNSEQLLSPPTGHGIGTFTFQTRPKCNITANSKSKLRVPLVTQDDTTGPPGPRYTVDFTVTKRAPNTERYTLEKLRTRLFQWHHFRRWNSSC